MSVTTISNHVGRKTCQHFDSFLSSGGTSVKYTQPIALIIYFYDRELINIGRVLDLIIKKNIIVSSINLRFIEGLGRNFFLYQKGIASVANFYSLHQLNKNSKISINMKISTGQLLETITKYTLTTFSDSGIDTINTIAFRIADHFDIKFLKNDIIGSTAIHNFVIETESLYYRSRSVADIIDTNLISNALIKNFHFKKVTIDSDLLSLFNSRSHNKLSLYKCRLDRINSMSDSNKLKIKKLRLEHIDIYGSDKLFYYIDPYFIEYINIIGPQINVVGKIFKSSCIVAMKNLRYLAIDLIDSIDFIKNVEWFPNLETFRFLFICGKTIDQIFNELVILSGYISAYQSLRTLIIMTDNNVKLDYNFLSLAQSIVQNIPNNIEKIKFVCNDIRYSEESINTRDTNLLSEFINLLSITNVKHLHILYTSISISINLEKLIFGIFVNHNFEKVIILKCDSDSDSDDRNSCIYSKCYREIFISTSNPDFQAIVTTNTNLRKLKLLYQQADLYIKYTDTCYNLLDIVNTNEEYHQSKRFLRQKAIMQ